MRKKKIIYVLLLLFMAGFAQISCVEEVSQPGGGKAPAGEGYLSLGIDMGNLPLSTRSVVEERGAIDELKIHDIRIVLYDGTDENPGSCKVEYAFDLDIHTPNTWTNTSSAAGWLEGTDLHGNPSDSGAKLTFVTKPMIVADKPYKMLVLINGKGVQSTDPQSLYSITEKGRYLHELNKAVKVNIDPVTGTVKNGKGFFMSNHQGLVRVTQAQLFRTDDDAVTTPVSVYVARMVAKVMVKHGNFTFPQGFDASSATWGLAVTNQKTYWMRKGLAGEGSHTSMINLYAEDPNYSTLGLDMNSHFHNVLYQGSGSVKVSSSMVSNEMTKYEYLLENTISAATSTDTKDYLDQATHVVVGYKYTPAGYSASDSYYIFNKQIISVAEMNSFRAGGNIPQSMAGLRQVIESIQTTNPALYPLDGSSTMYYETGGLRFCPQGQVYYYFPIRHFEGPAGSLGYYGVVRNNVYEVTINSLKAPENDDEFLSADITIMPWNLRSQSNTVGISVIDKKWAPVTLFHYYNYKVANLYELWTGGEYECQTVMLPVGNTAYGETYKKDDKFRASLSSYNDIYYTYAVPNQIIVSENAADNKMELIYTRSSYAMTNVIGNVPLCFVDANGKVLSVQGIDEYSSIFTNNPRVYRLNLVGLPPFDSSTESYTYLKHLPTLFDMRITDTNNIQYKIVETPACARYYDHALGMNSGLAPGTTLSFKPGSTMAEPVEVGSPFGLVLSNRGVAIICEPL